MGVFDRIKKNKNQDDDDLEELDMDLDGRYRTGSGDIASRSKGRQAGGVPAALQPA